ncbi:MAG: putative aminohydrolase SsnA [Firmicutes bacterium]|nr:putative aminohydrolase SsnA [Bacillota bacterium]
MYLIGNGRLISRDPARPYFEQGAVVTEGDRIREVGEYAALRRKYPQAQLVDAHGGLIMPAFINVHSHIYSGLARGLSVKGYDPTNFLEILQGLWWTIDRKLDEESTLCSAYATILDGIRTGCTTIFDHHAGYGWIEGSLFTIATAVRELGVRACLCYEVSDRDGLKKRDAAIRENGDFISWCRKERDPLLAAMFGGHALFTLSDATLDAMVKENDGRTGFHIHVAEGLNDVYDSAANYGTRPVNRLLNHGLLGEKTMLGHCIHVNRGEMDILRDTGTMVCTNPQSNMGNAVGCAPVLQLMAEGITVGLGTDSYTFDMLESLKNALTIQRHNACRPNVAWNEVTRMLFYNNPAICGRYFDAPLGVLKEGAAADVIVMDYKPFTPFGPDNVDGHLIFGVAGRQCETTMCAGRLLMQDRRLLGVDEDAINARILEAAQKLWKRING